MTSHNFTDVINYRYRNRDAGYNILVFYDTHTVASLICDKIMNLKP